MRGHGISIGDTAPPWRRLEQSLPPFPPVAAALLRLLSQEGLSPRDVQDLIRSDAVLSAEVLRLANSPIFGHSYEIINILHAITMLGADRLKGLVLTVVMRKVVASQRRCPSLKVIWRHNLACALAAESLAAACWTDGGRAYTAGLLHDIGALALEAAYPEIRERLAEESRGDMADLLKLEREAFGLDHCEAGMHLILHWGLPEDVAMVAARHHERQACLSSELEEIVNFSCRCAALAGFQEPANTDPDQRQMLRDYYSLMPPARRRNELAATADAIAGKINLFECEFQAL